ncbi:hypothetical protein HPB49_024626 [Dermacentor silvarum]|uniref:Uncharacterized protein n=1 Tax=Dermacentor silvarum TaxID=543639 RepID=A0ACB8DGY8_DERSI|nr:hypothetical protein HPB49_024626 [Dermacentor silvarum]
MIVPEKLSLPKVSLNPLTHGQSTVVGIRHEHPEQQPILLARTTANASQHAHVPLAGAESKKKLAAVSLKRFKGTSEQTSRDPMSRIKNRLRGSEESLASADDSIDETRSVMSFILSRLPEHASASGIAAAGAVPALSTGGTPSPLAEGSSGDGDGTTLSLPAPYPVEVRKLQWTAVAAHLPGLLKLLLLLAAHALLVVAFLDTGWDHKASVDYTDYIPRTSEWLHCDATCRPN